MQELENVKQHVLSKSLPILTGCPGPQWTVRASCSRRSREVHLKWAWGVAQGVKRTQSGRGQVEGRPGQFLCRVGLGGFWMFVKMSSYSLPPLHFRVVTL